LSETSEPLRVRCPGDSASPDQIAHLHRIAHPIDLAKFRMRGLNASSAARHVHCTIWERKHPVAAEMHVRLLARYDQEIAI
jgi:hypothetical protein